MEAPCTAMMTMGSVMQQPPPQQPMTTVQPGQPMPGLASSCCAVMCVAVNTPGMQGPQCTPPSVMWPVPVYTPAAALPQQQQQQQQSGYHVFGPITAAPALQEMVGVSGGGDCEALVPPSQNKMNEQLADFSTMPGDSLSATPLAVQQCCWSLSNPVGWILQPLPVQGTVNPALSACQSADGSTNGDATTWWAWDSSNDHNRWHASSSEAARESDEGGIVTAAAFAAAASSGGLRQRKRRSGKDALGRQSIQYQQELGNEDDDDAEDLEAEQQRQSESDRVAARAIADRLLRLLETGFAEDASMEFVRLAFADQVSSRAAQLAIEDCNTRSGSSNAHAALLSQLTGRVYEASRSMHANFVLQKIIEVMPGAQSAFIHRELCGQGVEVAKNRFGCRVMCRLLEHGTLASDPSLASLIQEIVSDGEALSRHTYGNYVVRHLLEFGLAWHKKQLAQKLYSDLPTYGRHRYGSRVVQMALQHCDAQDRQAIFEGLLASPDELAWLAKGLSGRHVVRLMLRSAPLDIKQRAVAILYPHMQDLEASKYGKLIHETLNAVCRG